MADTASFEAPTGGPRRWLLLAIILVVAGCLLWFLYRQITDVQGVRVEAPPTSVIDMLPPPPPPPPPPPKPQEKPPEPADKPDPSPSPEPEKAPDAPAPLSIAGPAQAGSDSFGLQSGTGQGTGGTGTCVGTQCGTGVGSGTFSDAFYRRYLSSALQERIESDNRVNRLVFTADFLITIDSSGKVTSVILARSSGKSDRDDQLKAILLGTAKMDPPPASVRFPQRITVRGRKGF